MSDTSTGPAQPEPEATGAAPAQPESPGAVPAGPPVPGPDPYRPGPAYGPPPPPGGYGHPGAGYGQPGGWPAPPPPRSTRTGKIIALLVAALVIAGFSAVAGGVVGAVATRQLAGGPGPAETTVVDGPQLDRASLASIASEVERSVVSVDVGGGQGSGVVMDADGHILTNAHVVAAGSGGDVTVRFSNGERVPAEVIGADERSDIAVVRAQDTSDLQPAAFGNSSDVLVGDTVLAIGSPLGLQGTVTQGIVSALDRTLQPQPGGSSLSGLLQTDAAINRGNSGGPLVNLSGEVIGINTAIAVENQQSGFLGVGFAVPSEQALNVAEQLIAGQEVQHAFLGVQIDPARDGGASIVGVQPGSPADEAGIQQGDVVVRFGDQDIKDANDLVSAVQSASVGDTVEIVVDRDGETVTLTATLGAYDD